MRKPKSCSISDCERLVLARGLCGRHYHQARNAGTLAGITGRCTEPGCSSASLARGLCKVHYPIAQQRGLVGKPCDHPGCTKSVFSHGKCIPHFGKAVRSGFYGIRCIIDGCRGYSSTISKQGYCDSCRGRIKRYGISDSDLSRLLTGTPCELCAKADAKHVDHCHKTGAVRGFLCGPCNMSLGSFNDCPTRLRAAADYIDRTSPKMTTDILPESRGGLLAEGP
jgi:hypothetical protein